MLAPFIIAIAANMVQVAFPHASPQERVKAYLGSKYYSVNWNPHGEFADDSEFVLGHGWGHGTGYGWMRFKPARDSVEVLSIELDNPWEQYRTKWPRDVANVEVRRATIGKREYLKLLADIAEIEAATFSVKDDSQEYWSTGSFWAHTELKHEGKSLIDHDIAEYMSGSGHKDYAKPRAMDRIALRVLSYHEFKPYKLTAEDRRWASAKFEGLWKVHSKLERYWWIRERTLMVIGVVGDESALPTLKPILEAEYEKDIRVPYHAVNAATRLLGKDVRTKPVEDMDVPKVKAEVLKLMESRK